ncbi:hypothetical protein PM082_021643 [Marasmius tenuissimus]|nr:hypothetical protein PM082_021643 [Marasmius tenuissimus]
MERISASRMTQTAPVLAVCLALIIGPPSLGGSVPSSLVVLSFTRHPSPRERTSTRLFPFASHSSVPCQLRGAVEETRLVEESSTPKPSRHVVSYYRPKSAMLACVRIIALHWGFVEPKFTESFRSCRRMSETAVDAVHENPSIPEGPGKRPKTTYPSSKSLQTTKM